MNNGGLARRALGGAAFCLVSLSVAAAAASDARPVRGSANAIVDLPVAFEVRNTNSSGFPCPSDGRAHTVRGQLVGPRSALDGPGPRAITLYLHGFNVGGFMWRLPGVPQLDHAAALARLGHVSLTIDRLGYDASGHPHGWQTCFGSQADVAHQLVGKLRSDDYSVTGGDPRAFSTVVLAGHDAGAAIADIVAYSYRDIDALVHFNWAEQDFTSTAQRGYVDTLPICAAGGQDAEPGPPARTDPASGPSGYVAFLSDEEIRSRALPNTDPRVIASAERRWNRNPCGEFTQTPLVNQINVQRLPEIRIPVLYGYTDLEFLWSQEGLAQQADHYRNSMDLSTVVIPNAGHFPMFSRLAPTFHSTVAEWLRSRGLLSAGARTSDRCPARNRTTAGGPGADRLFGGGGSENLAGHRGRDRLAGGGGADCLVGDAGADRIDVADGERDRVRCGRGRDRVRADQRDRLSCCERVRMVSGDRH